MHWDKYIFIFVLLHCYKFSHGTLKLVDMKLDPRLAKIRVDLKQKLQFNFKWKKHQSPSLPHEIHTSADNNSKPNGALFYNRIPKCGSSTAMKIMRKLSYRGSRGIQYHRNFQWIDGPWDKPMAQTYEETLRLVNELYHFNYSAWAYQRHVHFIDFDEFDIPWELQPNYINIMRDPVDQRMSWIYYFFTKKLMFNNTFQLDLEKCLKENQSACDFPPEASQSCILAGPAPACQLGKYSTKRPTKRYTICI